MIRFKYSLFFILQMLSVLKKQGFSYFAAKVTKQSLQSHFSVTLKGYYKIIKTGGELWKF